MMRGLWEYFDGLKVGILQKIIQIMDFFFYTAQTGDHDPCETNLALIKAQEEHAELQKKLSERLESLNLQANLIKNTLIDKPISKTSTESISIRNEQTIKNIHKFHKESNQQRSSALLKSQVKLESVAHYRSILKVFEEKIFEMSCNLYSKQVDISVDHVGKLQNEKPTLKTVKQFSRKQTQFNNIARFTEERNKKKRNQQKLREQMQLEDKAENYEKQVSETKKENSEDSTEMNSKGSTGKKSDSKIQAVQDRLATVPASEGRKLLLLGSQKNNRMYKYPVDPVYDNLLALLKSEILREQKLKKKLRQLGFELQQLNSTNKFLWAQCHKASGRI